MEDEERIHPAPVDRCDDEVASALRQELTAGRRNAEPEQAEGEEPNEERERPDEQPSV
jgi:hypothetical protein